jgi:hypothetical protein
MTKNNGFKPGDRTLASVNGATPWLDFSHDSLAFLSVIHLAYLVFARKYDTGVYFSVFEACQVHAYQTLLLYIVRLPSASLVAIFVYANNRGRINACCT